MLTPFVITGIPPTIRRPAAKNSKAYGCE